MNNFVAANVIHVIDENLLGKQIDEGLDTLGHLLGALLLVGSLDQRREVI